MLGEQEDKLRPIQEACRKFEAELPAFLEGVEGTSVRGHADECAGCRGVLETFEQIRSLAHDLPMLEPPEHLWSKVRATLAAEGVIHEPSRWQDRWISTFGLRTRLVPIAGLAGLVAFSALLVLPPNFNKAPSSGGVQQSGAVAAGSLIQDAQVTDLVKMLGSMERNYRQQEASLDPALQATYEKGLSALDASIDEASDSVKAEPDNALAREYLMEAYAAKAQVLASALETNGQ
jgi:hypothetical protein